MGGPKSDSSQKVAPFRPSPPALSPAGLKPDRYVLQDGGFRSFSRPTSTHVASAFYHLMDRPTLIATLVIRGEPGSVAVCVRDSSGGVQ